MRSTRKRFQLLIYHEASEKRSFLFTGRLHSPYIYILSFSFYARVGSVSNANKLSRYTGSRGEIETPRFSQYSRPTPCEICYVLITRRETSLHGNEIWQENHVTWIVVNPTVLYPRTIEGISVFRRCVCRNTRFEKRLRKL